MSLPKNFLDRLPSQSILPVQALCMAYPELHWKLSRPLQSRLGSYLPARPPLITLDEDLEPEPFLITLLHELAHHQVHKGYKRRKQAHGKEWKRAFGRLLLDFAPYFPSQWHQPLVEHAKNPSATLAADPAFYRLMRKQEPGRDFLQSLPRGTEFLFRGRSFRALEMKRTRRLCEELASGRRFLISGAAQVERSGSSRLSA